MNQTKCTVCGNDIVSDRAHVKSKHEFNESDQDRLLNIISLCPNHHRMFDRGDIGICPESHNLVLARGENLEVK